jgi:hypothetical protein
MISGNFGFNPHDGLRLHQPELYWTHFRPDEV